MAAHEEHRFFSPAWRRAVLLQRGGTYPGPAAACLCSQRILDLFQPNSKHSGQILQTDIDSRSSPESMKTCAVGDTRGRSSVGVFTAKNSKRRFTPDVLVERFITILL